MKIRRAHPSEITPLRELVRKVVAEVYGPELGETAVSSDEIYWGGAWVAIVDEQIAGVLLTGGDQIDDLWVRDVDRGVGVGTSLLEAGEAEIRSRGFFRARLRVVETNQLAINFYRKAGWLEFGSCQHERLPLRMVEMRKVLSD